MKYKGFKEIEEGFFVRNNTIIVNDETMHNVYLKIRNGRVILMTRVIYEGHEGEDQIIFDSPEENVTSNKIKKDIEYKVNPPEFEHQIERGEVPAIKDSIGIVRVGEHDSIPGKTWGTG